MPFTGNTTKVACQATISILGHCQAVRHGVLAPIFGGSNPSAPAIWAIISMAESSAHNREYLGSTPRWPTKGRVFPFVYTWAYYVPPFLNKPQPIRSGSVYGSTARQLRCDSGRAYIKERLCFSKPLKKRLAHSRKMGNL